MAENNRALNVRFGADTSELSKGVAELRQKLTALNTSLAENKQKISDTNSELKKLQKEEKELSAAMRDGGTDEQKAQLQALKDKIAQTTANLGQLRATEAELRADVRNTTMQLQQQKAGMDSNVKSAGLLDKALGKISATAKAFIGIYGAKKLWELLFGSNAEMEQYQTSFEVMLSDAEKAEQMIEDLRAFAADTPLVMDDVVSTGTLLMNYGVADNNLISTMTKLGDLASGNVEKLNRVSLAYGQMLAKGKVSGEELRQMTEAGVPLQDALAKSIGVTGEELSKMVSAGKVGIDDLNKAIDSLTTGNGKFAGMMKKQAQTMNGMLSTLQDNVSEFLRKVGEGAFGEVKDVLAELMDKLNEWEEDGTLEKWADSLGTTVETLIKLLEGAIEIGAEFKDELLAIFAGKIVYNMANNFIPNLKKIKKGFTDLKNEAKDTAEAMNIKAMGISAILVAIGYAVQQYREGNAIIDEYNESIKNLEEQSQKTVSSAQAETDMLKIKYDRYEELRTAAELTAAEEAELKSISAELQEVFGDDVTVIDKVTGSYNDLSAAVEQYTEKRMAQAKYEAQYNLVEGYMQELADIEAKQKALTEGWTQEQLNYAKNFTGTFQEGWTKILRFIPGSWDNPFTDVDMSTLNEYAQYQYTINELKEKLKPAQEALADLTTEIYSTGDAADDGKDRVKDLSDASDEAASSVDELNKMLGDFSSALQEQAENGQLSYQTIMQLIDAGYAQCLQIDNETGAVRLNAEAYRDLAKAKIEARMAELAQTQARADSLRGEYIKKINTSGQNRDWTGVSAYSRELTEKIAELDLPGVNAESTVLQQLLDSLNKNPSYNPYVSSSSGKSGGKSNSGYSDAYNAYKTEADKKIQLIKDELAAKKELRDKTIEYLDDEIKKRKELNEDNDMQKQIDKVKAQLEYSQLDEFSRGQLEKELQNLEEEREEVLWQRQMQEKKDQANAAYAAAEENAAKAQEQINNAVDTVKQIMDNLSNGISNISNIISNNTNTVNNTQNINLASQYLTMAQITKAIRDALIGTVLIR